MAIKLDCPKCGRKLRIRDQHAGRKGRCPDCKGRIRVPRNGRAPESEKGPSSQRAGSSDPPLRPTRRQRELAADLGIDLPVRITRQEATELLDEALHGDDPRLSRALPDDMMRELERRGLKAIVLCWEGDNPLETRTHVGDDTTRDEADEMIRLYATHVERRSAGPAESAEESDG